jgi:hypothetical protein
MKKSSDTIRKRTRDLPVCSAVSQPLRHQVPPLINEYRFELLLLYNRFAVTNTLNDNI